MQQRSLHYYADLRFAVRHLFLWILHPERTERSDMLFTLPVLVFVFLSFLLGTSEFLVIGILPVLAADLNVSLTIAGGLVSLFAFAYAAGTILLTSATARANRRSLLLVLVIAFVLGNLISAAADSYLLFLASRFVVAGVSGTLISVAMTFANDITSPKNRPAMIAWIYSGFSIAAVVGVPAGTMLAAFWGWRLSFVLISVLSVVLFFLLLYCLPRVAASPGQKMLHQFVLFADRRILPGIAIVICSAAATYAFYTYLTPIFETEIGIPAGYLGAALMAFGACSIASNLLSGRIAARKGIAGLRVPFVLQILLLAFLPVLLGFPAAGFCAILGLGVLMYLMNASTQMHFLDVAVRDHPDAVNLASSIAPVSFNIGIGLGALLGGVVVDAAGLREVGYCGALLAAGALAAVIVLMRQCKGAADGCYR